MSANILVVDHSATIRAMIRKVLTIGGLKPMTVHEAGSGREALEVLSRSTIDLVFTEVNLPDMKGDEILTKMTQRNLLPRVQVVFLSASRCRQRMDALKSKGARAYLTKPFRLEHIRSAVVTLLGKAMTTKG